MPAYLWRVWSRGRHEPGYRRFWKQRLGWYAGSVAGSLVDSPLIWLHAVSLGETRAATPLIQALRAGLPGMRLLLTHTTATGREAGIALLRQGDAQAWLPFDTPGAVRRFLTHFQPDLGVLMETEVWPNLMHEAELQGLPVVLANARLSEKSLRQGERFASLLKPAAAALRLTLAQTEVDAQRLRRMGAQEVEVVGNVKFDMTPAPDLLARGGAWRQALARAVVLAASTREGEEALLLTAWQRWWANRPAGSRPKLLIVPRHPQRFDEVAAAIEAMGWRVSRRSAWGDSGPDQAAFDADVWLGDSMGEMPVYYACADVGVLGGSFAPFGGQNMIEAAACGCPMVMGPSTFNFEQAAEQGLAAGAAWRVDTMDRAVELVARTLQDGRLVDAKAAALGFAATHRGASNRMRDAIKRLLPTEP
jgi:3-deoxy-D-manno-octulosonic-acid transferase